MKLTLTHAAFAPLRDRAATASVVLVRPLAAAGPETAVRARRGLTCHWTKDATGHLVCAWSDEPTKDHSITRRDHGRAGAALSMAA
jgi:hypothetical protein